MHLEEKYSLSGLSIELTFDRGHGFFQTRLANLPIFRMDEVAEWLRRWTANPMCSARVGSNPILVGRFIAVHNNKLKANIANNKGHSILHVILSL
jgi:hypothetical protein